jgi:hypothetical protein
MNARMADGGILVNKDFMYALVSYFTYHRIYTEGKYTVLLDRPDWAEHYVSSKVLIDWMLL